VNDPLTWLSFFIVLNVLHLVFVLGCKHFEQISLSNYLSFYHILCYYDKGEKCGSIYCNFSLNKVKERE